jgi:hypothetical protein
LPLQLVHRSIGVEMFDRDAEMIQSGIRILEDRKEVLAQAEEAVTLRLVEDR